MGDTVLVAFDGSPLARRALTCALELRPGDDVVVLHVVDPVYAVYEAELRGPSEAEAWSAEASERSEQLLEAAADLAATHDREVTTVSDVGKPKRCILDAIEAHGVDHVFLGSHGRSGVSRLVMGSTAEAVMRQSPVPVTVVR